MLQKGVVIPSGLEPETVCLEGRCSIQLSYGTSCGHFRSAKFGRWRLLLQCRGLFYWPGLLDRPPTGGPIGMGMKHPKRDMRLYNVTIS